MSHAYRHGDRIDVHIGGAVEGQVAAGRQITQEYVAPCATSHSGVSGEELDEFSRMVAEVKARITAEAPAEQRAAAIGRIDDVQGEVLSGKPSPSTLEYVRNWFSKHLPKLAGAIVGLVVHPVVGKLVEAAGDVAATEFRMRFDEEKEV